MVIVLTNYTAVMVTCTRPAQNQVSQYFGMDGRGTHESPSIAKDLLATDGYQGKGSHFSLGYADTLGLW